MKLTQAKAWSELPFQELFNPAFIAPLWLQLNTVTLSTQQRQQNNPQVTLTFLSLKELRVLSHEQKVSKQSSQELECTQTRNRVHPLSDTCQEIMWGPHWAGARNSKVLCLLRFLLSKKSAISTTENTLANSFVNKRENTVHPTYAENDKLFIRAHINTNQDWFLFSMN